MELTIKIPAMTKNELKALKSEISNLVYKSTGNKPKFIKLNKKTYSYGFSDE